MPNTDVALIPLISATAVAISVFRLLQLVLDIPTLRWNFMVKQFQRDTRVGNNWFESIQQSKIEFRCVQSVWPSAKLVLVVCTAANKNDTNCAVR